MADLLNVKITLRCIQSLNILVLVQTFICFTVLRFCLPFVCLSSATARTSCENGSCVTFDDGVITAEVGLCVIIQCSYTVNFGLSPQSIIWSKCERPRCVDSEIIFNSLGRNRSTGFKGRVSLLEPDINVKNCSIIINDLTVSDSGSYQLSIDGYLLGKPSRHVYSARVKVIVRGMKSFHRCEYLMIKEEKCVMLCTTLTCHPSWISLDLTQKPAVTVPTLAEGWEATLSCTAPGLCTGSDPKIQWLWRGSEKDNPHISGSTILYQTATLTAVTQRHSSTLTFKPTVAGHDGSEVTCTVSFPNSIRTEETVLLRVT